MCILDKDKNFAQVNAKILYYFGFTGLMPYHFLQLNKQFNIQLLFFFIYNDLAKFKMPRVH